jgi:indolepyruvate ferredoxin oxidoreductase
MNAPCPATQHSSLESISLDDKYALDHGPAFMSGVQALVKLPMLQRQRDLALGKNTAGFVSGYRGSPLGGYDQALAKAEQYLKAHHIVFQPGVNEELAATALWGTQQLGFARRAATNMTVFLASGTARARCGPLQRRVQTRQHGWHHRMGRRDCGGGR